MLGGWDKAFEFFCRIVGVTCPWTKVVGEKLEGVLGGAVEGGTIVTENFPRGLFFSSVYISPGCGELLGDLT